MLLSAPVAVSHNEIIQLVQSGCHLYSNLLLSPQTVKYTSEDTNLNITHSSWNPCEIDIVRILMQDYKAFLFLIATFYFLIAKFQSFQIAAEDWLCMLQTADRNYIQMEQNFIPSQCRSQSLATNGIAFNNERLPSPAVNRWKANALRGKTRMLPNLIASLIWQCLPSGPPCRH